MDIKSITTRQLISELCSRPGIKKIAVGPYKSHSLKEKYTFSDDEIKSDCVLIIDGSLDKTGSSSKRT